jgi:magnesium-transporting ATPase (P-type)
MSPSETIVTITLSEILVFLSLGNLVFHQHKKIYAYSGLQRISVIVRDLIDDHFELYCKGAPEMIASLCNELIFYGRALNANLFIVTRLVL